MKRVAVILSKHLDRGQASNVAAILMGQAALLSPDIYGLEPVSDANAHPHAAIRYSTVALEANGTAQLINFINKARAERPNLLYAVFSKTGQGLHNRFEDYCDLITSNSIDALEPVGVVVVGEDAVVRETTKKFSLLK